jgi:hypothetical protein
MLERVYTDTPASSPTSMHNIEMPHSHTNLCTRTVCALEPRNARCLELYKSSQTSQVLLLWTIFKQGVGTQYSSSGMDKQSSQIQW